MYMHIYLYYVHVHVGLRLYNYDKIDTTYLVHRSLEPFIVIYQCSGILSVFLPGFLGCIVP